MGFIGQKDGWVGMRERREGAVRENKGKRGVVGPGGR